MKTTAIVLLSVLLVAGCEPSPSSSSVAPRPPVEPTFTSIGTNAQGYAEYKHDQTGIVFVRLPGGELEIGGPEDEGGRRHNESVNDSQVRKSWQLSPRPVRTVRLSPFLISKYEVTQAEYEAGMGSNPSHNKGNGQRPVEGVTWGNLRAGNSSGRYRDGFLARTGLLLPSEAQWEYACRAGQAGPYSGTGNLDDMGWYSDNSGKTTHAVGGKSANQFGLHDMHGNVAEWCEDVVDLPRYGPRTDPRTICMSGFPIVVRGGSYVYPADGCTSANYVLGGSGQWYPGTGFRPVARLP